ncbi:tRNA (N(6)-L-threonylcarbamoyladenosine(37)-C(2))-methylthiotransferase MtaB [Schlesneria paludicola]|uniref:tRNA (N(6)-L-threonylcarbamoyladenosine(37)-C(2))- methylthiotransferase MtaB n=1 Tax=Schlesneria paludicola TaxID=360056 RepID=UPI001ED8FED2|nr:tRNA (N(6)-L-threonylcarbamoyladenosine(37)-C(2))-methylthiotransferase MtaB [Schlesneria paludicola]
MATIAAAVTDIAVMIHDGGKSQMEDHDQSMAREKLCRLVTLGCKVNQYETQLVLEALERNGFREAQDDETADLCVVNTCTVTSNADSRSRQVIRQLAKHNPGTRTLVMGCYATRDPAAIQRLPSVFEVVTDKRELPDILARQGIVDMPTGISRFEGRRRAYVKVQDGCILRCTYCIIPQVRPGLRSRSAEDIEAEVRRLIHNGYKEIIITGVHVGHYGVDTSRGRSGQARFRLPDLLRQLDRIPGDWRMRLSSIEAAEVDDAFIAAAADCQHLCPQFHPALQSGSNSVLQRMRRRYSVESFLDKLARMRELLEIPAFATDVIVGFPGETEAEFEETLETCRRAEFMKMHIFPFSPRTGTPAATYPDQVHGTVRQERITRLEQLERELAEQYYRKFVGQRLEVMVESLSTRPGMVCGTDRRYIPVELPGSAADIGTICWARGTRTDREFLDAARESADNSAIEARIHGSPATCLL